MELFPKFEYISYLWSSVVNNHEEEREDPGICEHCKKIEISLYKYGVLEGDITVEMFLTHLLIFL